MRVTRGSPRSECSICRELPERFQATDGDWSPFPAAGKLEEVFSCDDSGALPEHTLLRCPVCGACYLRSSYATMTGGDWETADSCRRLDQDAVRALERLLRGLAELPG